MSSVLKENGIETDYKYLLNKIEELTLKIDNMRPANREPFNYEQGLSYIEPHEEQEAKRLIEESLGFEIPRPAGYNLLVKIHYKTDEVTEAKDKFGNVILGFNGIPLVIPKSDVRRATEKWSSLTALVCSIGPSAFMGEQFRYSGRLCKIGDYVVIPRSEGMNFDYHGVTMQLIPDDRIAMVVKDPDAITRGN